MPERLRWPLPDRADLRDRLVAAYSSGRGYHDLRHLAEVLDRIGELGAGNDDTVVLAAWFHDAVYQGRADDEERSAQLAVAELAGVELAGEVARLVRLTRTHRPEPADRRGEILCDADLAILAAAPARYRDYVAGVRREYAAHSDSAFRAGRLAVLLDLAAKPALFHTAHAVAAWEPAARANLTAEIAALRG